MKRGSNASRRLLATGAAVCLHLLALLALGRRAPQLSPPPPDTRPSIQISLVRPSPAQPTPGATGPRRAKPPPETTTPPSLPAPPPSIPAPPASGLAAGPVDCEPEDLPLLTEEEKKRCRNAIDADNARRLARGAVERLAKEAGRARSAPSMYRMDADKEASYAAAAKADEWKSLPPPIARAGPPIAPAGPPLATGGSRAGVGVTCSHVNIPILSGVETNPNLFAKKHKQERPAHGPSPCSAGIR